MLRQDLTFAVRRLRSSPGFTPAAIATLALGIGANVTIFCLVNAVVFRPFGVRNQSELVSFNYHTSRVESPSISWPDYKDYRDRNTAMSGLAAYHFLPMNVSRGGGHNTRLWGYAVSGNYFDMLGVQPLPSSSAGRARFSLRKASPAARERRRGPAGPPLTRRWHMAAPRRRHTITGTSSIPSLRATGRRACPAMM
jgi:hypothetical protein